MLVIYKSILVVCTFCFVCAAGFDLFPVQAMLVGVTSYCLIDFRFESWEKVANTKIVGALSIVFGVLLLSFSKIFLGWSMDQNLVSHVHPLLKSRLNIIPGMGASAIIFGALNVIGFYINKFES